MYCTSLSDSRQLFCAPRNYRNRERSEGGVSPDVDRGLHWPAEKTLNCPRLRSLSPHFYPPLRTSSIRNKLECLKPSSTSNLRTFHFSPCTFPLPPRTFPPSTSLCVPKRLLFQRPSPLALPFRDSPSSRRRKSAMARSSSPLSIGSSFDPSQRTPGNNNNIYIPLPMPCHAVPDLERDLPSSSLFNLRLHLAVWTSSLHRLPLLHPFVFTPKPVHWIGSPALSCPVLSSLARGRLLYPIISYLIISYHPYRTIPDQILCLNLLTSHHYQRHSLCDGPTVSCTVSFVSRQEQEHLPLSVSANDNAANFQLLADAAHHLLLAVVSSLKRYSTT